MPSIDEGHTEPWHYIKWPVVWNARHEFDRPRRMTYRIQRLYRVFPSPLEELCVFLLDMGRVGQHDGAEVACRRCAPNRSVITVTREEWQAPGMIDMCVRQHDGIDLVDRNWKVKILLMTLAAAALKEAAVEYDCLPRNAEHVAGPRDLTSRADEFDLHNSLDERWA